MINILSVYYSCKASPVSQCAKACFQGGKTSMQLTAVPSPSKCFFTGITTLGELFQKGDGGPSSELIIARKNKLQPYFPVSLIYKGFFFLLPFVCLFSTGLAKFAKLSEVGRRESLFCTRAWRCFPIAFFPYATMGHVEFTCHRNCFCN